LGIRKYIFFYLSVYVYVFVCNLIKNYKKQCVVKYNCELGITPRDKNNIYIFTK